MLCCISGCLIQKQDVLKSWIAALDLFLAAAVKGDHEETFIIYLKNLEISDKMHGAEDPLLLRSSTVPL